MRSFFTVIIVFINFIIESSLFQYLEIRGIKPNTSVGLTVSYAILRGSAGGAIVGFLSGILQDIFFGSSIGYYALIYMTIGYVSGLPTESFFKNNFFLPLTFSTCGMFLCGLFVYITGFLIRGKLDFAFYLSNIILPETVYTAVFTLFVYQLLFSFNKRLEEYEYKKRKVF